MATKQTTKKKDGIPVSGIAAGVAAAAAAAGTAYYFYGTKSAKRHRAAAAKWAAAMKREVVKDAKKIQALDEKVMHGVIDRVAGTYRAARSVDPQEILQAAGELKRNWQKLRAELKRGGSRASAKKRPAKKSAEKAAKRRSA